MLKKLNKKTLIASTVGALTLLPISAFAEDGIPQIISTAATSMKTDALAVMTSGVTLGLVFWGGKLLWSKFKSMAK